jgi:hypothetical protein
MPEQNPVTRLYAVATGLGLLADELEKLYGEPTPNLLYWREEVIEVADKLRGHTPASPDPQENAG